MVGKTCHRLFFEKGDTIGRILVIEFNDQDSSVFDVYVNIPDGDVFLIPVVVKSLGIKSGYVGAIYNGQEKNCGGTVVFGGESVCVPLYCDYAG